MPGNPATSSTRSLLRRFAATGIWVVLGRVLGVLSLLLSNMVFARYLSTEDFGEFVMITSVVTAFSIVAMFGVNRAIVKWIAEARIAESGNPIRSVLYTAMVAAVIAAAVTAPLMYVFFRWYQTLSATRPPFSCSLAVAWAVLLAWHQILAEALRALRDNRSASMLAGQAGGPLVTFLAVALVLVAVGDELASLDTVLLMTVIASSFLLLPALYMAARAAWALEPHVSARARDVAGLSLSSVLACCTPLVLTQLVLIVTAQADIWVAGSLLPATEVGLYGAAKRLMQIVALPSFLANMTIIATVAELKAQDEMQRLGRLIRTTSLAVTITSTLLFAPMLLLSEGATTLLFGPNFAGAAPLALTLSLGTLAYACCGSCLLVLMVTGHERASLFATLAGAVVLFVAGGFAAQSYGLWGLAVSASLALATQSFMAALMVWRKLGIWPLPTIWLRPAPSAVRDSAKEETTLEIHASQDKQQSTVSPGVQPT